MNAATRATAWFALLAGAAFVLRSGASGALAAPPLGSSSDLLAWTDGRSPAAATMALVRLFTEWTVWYLLAVSALHLLAATTRREAWIHAVGTISPRLLRRILDAGLGIGILATTFAPPVPVAGAAQVPATEVVPSGTATMRPVAGPPPGTATARPVAPSPQVDTASPGPAPLEVVPEAPATSTVEVAVGDSFWTLAEEHLGEGWGRSPGIPEVDAFWRAFVDINRHRLVDPDDPDLLLPGQVLELPPIPPPVA